MRGQVRGTYGREDISQKSKVLLVLLAVREFQSVEVCERDADVFSLASGVWSHRDVAVGATSLSRV